MARRLPSQPPILPGFSYIHVLGSGGFADVFLYEQNMPRRQVAVKVMLAEVVNDQVRQMFQAEANLMAQLSAHPSILTVYQASVSSDGRPYLVMELCSSSLSQRYRAERLPVAEVLRIAIKIGSAIETAHVAGVLHRDIKPSNILLTAYGHPVLSDFGIAATLSESDSQQAVGMSIPWSAPEVLMDETAGTIESEVWAFAATVYSLIAGRSPFEVPGESNTSVDLISRINRAKAQPIGRPDVPASLERALTRGMSKAPKNRPASVIELVRELQSIESELGVAQTPVEVAVDDWALATVADLEDRTRVRGVANASGAVPTNRRRRRAPQASADYEAVGTLMKNSDHRATDGHRSVGGRSAAPGHRSFGATKAPAGRSMQTLSWILVACAALVIALGATATFVLIKSTSNDIPVVSDIAAIVDGDNVRFSWQNPGLEESDAYQIALDGGEVSVQSTPEFLTDGDPGDHVCISVRVSRDGTLGDSSNPKCVDIAG
ncbi:serine/threonine-protein kinase [Conyzicola sp.]|uniref:serine/threonine-protein kinase n=1 Tax=Conyzicola sp. TaxID=1969404 RepID=UPI00398A3662